MSLYKPSENEKGHVMTNVSLTPGMECVYGNRRISSCDSARSDLLHPHRAYSVVVYILIILRLCAA